MALTLKGDTEKSIGVAEYEDFVKREVDFDDLDSVLASAPMLRALSNNKQFLPEFLNDKLSQPGGYQWFNNYSAQTIVISFHSTFSIRVNMWEPPRQNPEETAWHNAFYYYLVPHDHNFSFMTVGHRGTGYATTIYEADTESISSIPGDPANLTFSERTTLPEGKVMFYRAGTMSMRRSIPKSSPSP